MLVPSKQHPITWQSGMQLEKKIIWALLEFTSFMEEKDFTSYINM